MSRPIESDYTSQVAYTRALEAYCDSLAQQEPVLVVRVEPDYMSGGHHYKGSKPYIDLKKLGKIPIGTELYTSPPAQHEHLTDKDFELNWMNYQKGFSDGVLAGIEQLKQALMQPKQRTWVGLTEGERDTIFELHHTKLGGWDYGGEYVMYDRHFENAVAAIEAKLKEKNT